MMNRVVVDTKTKIALKLSHMHLFVYLHIRSATTMANQFQLPPIDDPWWDFGGDDDNEEQEELDFSGRTNHHLNVEIDDETLKALTLSDLVTLSQQCVSHRMMSAAMQGPRRKKQFVAALLKALEWNEIYVARKTTLAEVLEETKDFAPSDNLLNSFSEQIPRKNHWRFYLIHDDPRKGFHVPEETVWIRYSTCPVCERTIPEQTRCPHAMNRHPDAVTRDPLCITKLPVTDHYQDVEMVNLFNQMCVKIPAIGLERHRFISYLFNEAEAYQVSDDIQEGPTVQLDAAEYRADIASTPRLRNLSSYLDRVYFRGGETDYYEIYSSVCYSTRCGFDAALRGVDSWIEQTSNWSELDKEVLHHSRTNFLDQEESYRNDTGLWLLDNESEDEDHEGEADE